MKHFTRIGMSLLLSLLLIISFSCTKQKTKEEISLTVSAAASLQDALKEIQTQYEEDHINVKLSFNFGSSGALQQQIEQGAPVDLFFSAAEDKFRTLVDKELIAKDEGTNLLGNELVLVAPKDKADTIKGFEALTNKEVKQIAMGAPESVPAGKYGKQALTSMNLWKTVEGKVIFAKDVRQVLTYVETGNVEAGIVYKTDAQASDQVQIVEAAAATTHDPIIYPLGIIKDTKHKKEAMAFYQYLQTNEMLQVFEKYGFVVIK